MVSLALVAATSFGLAVLFGAPATRADPGPDLPGVAQDVPNTPDAQRDRERALSIGRNAIELFHQGNYHLALERFQSAERARHSPVFLLYIARSHERLGHLREAKSHYERILAEPLPPAAPAPWISARDDAALELRELEPRIPSIQIRVVGDGPAELRLDGRTVAAGVSEVWLDPGEHELVATDGHGRAAVKRFSVAEGERSKLVELTPASVERTLEGGAPSSSTPAAAKSAGSARTAKPAGSATASALSSNSEPRSGGNTSESRVFDPLGIALLSAGTLGVVVGVVTGLLSLNRTQAIQENCDGRHCRPEDADEGAAADRLALASSIAFIVGGTAFASFAVRAWVLPSAPVSGAPRQSRANFGISGRF